MRKLTITLLFLAFTFSGCRFISQSFEPKPVNIDGLGSLQSLQDKQLTDEEFSKVIKTLGKENRVNEKDAYAMLRMFHRHIRYLFDASQLSLESEKNVGSKDVKQFLRLIFVYKEMNEPIREAIMNESRRIIEETVNFTNPENNVGSSVGRFQQIYVEASIDNKNKESINDFVMVMNSDNQLMVLHAVEQAAYEKISKLSINDEQKSIVQAFIDDIRIYNDSLPANAKILDSNGRLKDTRTADIDSLRAMIRLSQGGIEDKTKPEAERASGKVGDIVRPTADAIEAKIKGAYKQ